MSELIGYLSEVEQLNGTLSDPGQLVGNLSLPVAIGGGLSEEVKQALLDLFQHLAYTDADGQDYYDALYDALYPPAELVRITAVYTQTSVVYPDTPLDDLKDDLVVTAHYSDGTSEAVTTYTLSGTLTAGTSTVTVTYEDKTTTFNVTVSAPAVLSSISAVYTQSGVVYPTDSLDSLKPDLVVTAHYSDSSTATVTTYTLSGTLTVGTSTITVTYSGKTTTFNVTVTEAVVLDSITAVYTQSGTVYDTDSLDSLKADLVVTAVYTDSSTEVVPSTDYTLSGTLTAGTSTITVSYEGETTTFTVSVTNNPYWAKIPISQWVAGATPNSSYNSQLGGYYSSNSSRCCLFLTDYVLEAGYKYTFEHDGSSYNFGGIRWDATCLTAVANHANINSYNHVDSGWLSSGATYTPDRDRVCHIQWQVTKATLEANGVTEFRIIKEAV